MLLAGKLDDDGFCYVDQSFVPDGVNLNNLNFVHSGKSSWLIEMGANELSNGCWLLDIDGTLDVYAVSRRQETNYVLLVMMVSLNVQLMK